MNKKHNKLSTYKKYLRKVQLIQDQIRNELDEGPLQDKLHVVDSTRKLVPSNRSGKRSKAVLKNLPMKNFAE